MLQRFLSLRPFVNEILNKNITTPEMISAQCVLDITEVVEVLKPLEAATRELCDEFYVTSTISSKLKVALIEQCQKRLGNIESVTTLSKALKVISDKLKKSADQNIPKPLPNLIDQNQNTTEGFSLWDNHYKLILQNNQDRIESEIEYPSELCLYLKSNLGNLSEKPLEIWHNMNTVYPNLSKLAFKYLSVVASSVPSERLFFKAESTLSTKKNRITCKRLHKLLFLQSIDDYLWGL
ncbi:hypothetical protein AGLY_000536 [Aphis glycines]|uniref:HAT C-terminal dimerisation domain-containing protein n=1 Tax=Aphis glycines TaxID=307491 RepID=A0A6G0U7R6_APHGL|nr:hypothetical protein AGLY_000536 [Aphis glycines]